MHLNRITYFFKYLFCYNLHDITSNMYFCLRKLQIDIFNICMLQPNQHDLITNQTDLVLNLHIHIKYISI